LVLLSKPPPTPLTGGISENGLSKNVLITSPSVPLLKEREAKHFYYL
jgi:hypothetical protein